MKKTTCLILILISIIISFLYLYSYSKKTKSTINYFSISKAIDLNIENSKEIEVALMMPKINEAGFQVIDGSYPELKSLYDIDDSSVEEFILKIPKENGPPNEIFIAKSKDDNSMKMIKKGIQKRMHHLLITHEKYLPSEFELIANSDILINGKYILFVIGDNDDYIENIFINEFDQ